MSLKQQILDYAISHWHNNFTGVSAISIADDFSCLHEDVLAIFDELRDEGQGTLRENVKLYRLSVPSDSSDWYDEGQEIETTIFFPAKALLTETFYSGTLSRQNVPEYLARLHKGGSQIHLCYFSITVLKKYLDQQEIYDIEDSVAGGLLTWNSEYLSQFEDNEAELEGIMFVRYGKRSLSNQQIAVTAILHDLSEMPASEQRYWHSYELMDPTFAKSDPDFERFYRRNFEAEWVDYSDPLEKALNELSQLNKVLNGASFFTSEQNAYLAYPVGNTYKNFCDSCSELYKLIGPDNINNKTLKGLLQNNFGHSEEDFVHKKSGRPLSKLQLLDLLANHINSARVLLSVIEEIQEHRISADHRIIEPHSTNANFVTDFRNICENLYKALAAFADEIKVLLNK